MGWHVNDLTAATGAPIAEGGNRLHTYSIRIQTSPEARSMSFIGEATFTSTSFGETATGGIIMTSPRMASSRSHRRYPVRELRQTRSGALLAT